MKQSTSCDTLAGSSRPDKRHQTILAAVAGAACLALAVSTQAATYQWTNAASGSFLNAANWTNTASPYANGVPGSADTAINNLPGSTTTISAGDAVAVTSVQAQSGTISMSGGTLSASSVQATGSNGLFSISGGTANLANFQIVTAGYATLAVSGGTTTVTTDSRIGVANGTFNVSGGALNLGKLTLGSAAASNTNNVMTVSGDAVVNQNQSGSGQNRELWLGGNNGGSGTLILKDNAVWTNSALNGSTDVIVGRAASSGQTPVGILTISNNASFVVQAGAAAAKVIRLADNSSGATGTLNLNGGNLSTVGFQRGSGTGIINVNSGKLTALAASANFFSNFSGVSGNNSVNLVSGSLTFDTVGNAVTATNVLSGAGGVTKLGAGTLTLSAANTYTGPTVVSAGGLVVTTASTGAGDYAVADGASLEVQLSGVGKSLTNSSLALGTFSSLTNIFTLGANGSTTIPVIVDNGVLNLNGTVYVTVNGSGLTASTYPLISYSSLSGSGTFVTVSTPAVAGYSAVVVNDTVNKQVKLVYTALPLPSVKWAIGDGAWDTTSSNWKLIPNNSTTTYNEKDYVTFDDTTTGSSPITVTLTGDRNPTAVSNNAAKTYILAGGFSVTNSVLVKDGNGTLIVDNGSANSFQAVTINNGTVQLGNNDVNGSLGSSAITDNGALALNRTDNLTVSNVISGSGSLVKNGSGSLTLTAANSHSGLTAINNGQIILGNNLVNSTVSNTVANGLAFDSTITTATLGGLAGNGDITLANGASAAVTLTVGGNNQASSYSGSFSGNGKLLKAGTNTLTLSGNSSLSVIQVAAAGTLGINGGYPTVGNLQITANNGSLVLSDGATTVTTDSRIGAANATYIISGGSVSLPKVVIGSASASNTNNLMIVSGNAMVNQNQTGGNTEEQLWIGGNNSGSGALLLKDNASWYNSNTDPDSADANGNPIVAVGNNGTGQGSLTLQDNASFSYANTIRVANNSGNVGTVNLNGGVLSVAGIRKGDGTGTVNVNGGKIAAAGAIANLFPNFGGTGGSNSVNLVSGSLTLDTAGNPVTITNVLSGAGGLTVQGGGTLLLTSSNSYTGPTVVSFGTLVLTNAGSINSSSAISNNSFTTLDVSAASTPLAIGGTLSLSDSTLVANFTASNITVGALATAGYANTIRITALPSFTLIPARVQLLKYTTAAPGLVDGNNVLTTLSAVLPTTGNQVGYLTNNTANKSIDLVITTMTLAPVITVQPAPDSAYTNGFAHFSVQLELTNSPTYQWRKDGVPLSNGGHVAGANTAYLKLSNVSAADLGDYDVVIANGNNAVTSSAAPLTLVTPSGYEAAAVALGPVSLYMFDDSNDPTLGNAPAYDFAGDLDGIYGAAAQNGSPAYNIAGPLPTDGFPHFAATNLAAHFAGATANSCVTIPALNLNTNTVTLAGWIKPSIPGPNAGIIFCRGAGTVAGLNFTANGADANSNRTLGYTWNNEGGTYGWDSQIAPLPGQWSFVALVIAPTNATIYILDTNGLRAASHGYTHITQSFSTNAFIGQDPFGGDRQFDGSVDGVAIYGKALSQSELEALYTAASDVSSFAPTISSQPVSQTLYERQTATFSVAAAGSLPLGYQWQRFDGANYLNAVDGDRISGANSPTLVISNLALSDAANFIVVVTNFIGSVTSAVATLTVQQAGPAEAITNSVLLQYGQDWDTASAWSDGNPVSVSAASKPGSTYFVVPGGGLRTPNTTASVSFPGDILTVAGDGVYADGGVTNAGALMLKGQSPGITSFKKLVMNGGQILSLTDFNNASVLGGGELTILANTPIAGQTSTGGRSFTITSTLTGNGNVDYIGWANSTFQPTAVTALNIAGVNNIYSGTWNVIAGTLVGSTPGALGTNTITVGANGALQTTYNINNPKGALILNGRLNLTQEDTFQNVIIDGVSLAPGQYSFAQLNDAYPAQFPATWTGQTGAESLTNAAGSLTVLGTIPAYPTNITLSVSANYLSVSWPATHLGWILQQQTNSLGVGLFTNWTDVPGSAEVTATNIPVTPGVPTSFYRLRHP